MKIYHELYSDSRKLVNSEKIREMPDETLQVVMLYALRNGRPFVEYKKLFRCAASYRPKSIQKIITEIARAQKYTLLIDMYRSNISLSEYATEIFVSVAQSKNPKRYFQKLISETDLQWYSDTGNIIKYLIENQNLDLATELLISIKFDNLPSFAKNTLLTFLDSLINMKQYTCCVDLVESCEITELKPETIQRIKDLKLDQNQLTKL